MNGGGKGDLCGWRQSSALPFDGAAFFRAVFTRTAPVLRALRVPLAGLCLAGLQIALLLPLAPAGRDTGLSGRYRALFQHDSYWYESIIDRGYSSPVPPSPVKSHEISNVAFFPGYPLLAAWLGEASGLRTKAALLVTAQLGAWLFWSYAVAFLLKWGVPWRVGAAALAAILAHPAAFFVVAPYSESLFLAAVLGFIYWGGYPGRAGTILAAVHGFGMTAIRIAGIPCVGAAAMIRPQSRSGRGRLKRLRAAGFISFVSLLGALSFFVFCQARFGHWDFYMQTQAAGWGVRPDYFAPFHPELYTRLLHDWKAPRQLGQFSVAATFWICVAVAAAELAALRGRRGSDPGWRQRMPFYFCALAIFYISVAGVASVQFNSMIRYQFCTHVLLVLAVAHYLTRMPVGSLRSPWAGFATAAGLLLFLVIVVTAFLVQIHYGSVFMRGGWFA